MITAGRHPRASTSDRSRTIGGAIAGRSNPDAATQPVPATDARLRVITDIACTGLFVAVGVSAGFPLVWGLALHQTPMAVSGGCAELMVLVALLNRVFAPAEAKERAVPFLAALEERSWVLLVCLALAATSAVTLITCWPGTSA